MEREKFFEATLANLRAAFPGKAAVPVSAGAPAVGISHKTFRNRFNGGAGAPFATFKVGNKRLVALPELADFLTRARFGEFRDRFETREGEVRCVKRSGRPTREEERRALAAGISVAQLSLPPDWQFYLSELAARRDGHGNGRSATVTALKELQLAAYLRIERLRDGGRIVGTRWHVADRPIFVSKQDDSPQVDFLNEENQTSEKKRLQSKQVNKEDINTEAARAPARLPADAAAGRKRRKGEEDVRHGVEI